MKEVSLVFAEIRSNRVFVRLTSAGGHGRDPGVRFYLNTEMIVSFERRSDHTYIALTEDFEKVKETPEEIFSQLALHNAPPEKSLGDWFSE